MMSEGPLLYRITMAGAFLALCAMVGFGVGSAIKWLLETY